jgi:phage internal scaffolding protein
MFLRKDKKRKRVQLICKDKSLTQQHDKDRVDINKIMARATKKGMVDHINTAEPVYGDFTNVNDYHSALNQVLKAEAEFNNLSAEVRKHFQNDPAQLIQFMQDDKNYESAIDLGLIPKEKAKAYYAAKQKPDENVTTKSAAKNDDAKKEA